MDLGWESSLPASSQGTEQSRSHLGGIGHLPGDGDGPRIDSALVQDCPVRALLGQGLRAPEGGKEVLGHGQETMQKALKCHFLWW